MKLLFENVLGWDFAPTIAAWIAHPGPGAAFAVVALLVVDLFLPVPSSLVMVLSGAAFGVVQGAALALTGSIGCSILGFELTRRYGRRASARLVGDDELAKLERTFEQNGAGAVFITRALPVMMETMSVVAGLSRMKRSTFILATLAGTIPEVAIYAYAGAKSKETGSLVPAVVILLAVAGAGWMYWRGRTPASAS
jgi:uncharacterized membrane protein YdjX (TVP38/TMEM64 family)